MTAYVVTAHDYVLAARNLTFVLVFVAIPLVGWLRRKR